MSTIRERVAARRRAMLRDVNEGERFALPGYDDQLWVKMRYLRDDEFADINVRHDAPFARICEQVVVACDGFYETDPDAEQPEDGPPVLKPVTVDGKHVRFDRDLAGWMDFVDEVTLDGKVDPVDVLRAMLPKEQHIRLLHGAYTVWLVSASSEVDARLEGESEPTQTS